VGERNCRQLDAAAPRANPPATGSCSALRYPRRGRVSRDHAGARVELLTVGRRPRAVAALAMAPTMLRRPVRPYTNQRRDRPPRHRNLRTELAPYRPGLLHDNPQSQSHRTSHVLLLSSMGPPPSNVATAALLSFLHGFCLFALPACSPRSLDSRRMRWPLPGVTLLPRRPPS